MSKDAALKAILFESCSSTLYGAERSLLAVVEAMSPTWKPHFVVPKTGTYSDALKEANLPYDVVVPHYRLRFFYMVLRLAQTIRMRRASLVHANLHFSLPAVSAACQLTGVPFVVHLRLMTPYDSRQAPLFSRAAAVICISQAVKDSALKAGVISAEHQKRTWIIPDARDPLKYQRGDGRRIRRELGIGQDRPLIGMIARINPMKGQHVFLEAAALIADKMPVARFVLAGDLHDDNHRDYLKLLKRRCEEPPLRGRVNFLGYRTDISDILAALDCFVHPSSRGAFVSVLIEAMAAGIPIVASDVDGIPECVGRDGAAELVGNLDPAVWASAIQEIIHDPAQRSNMTRTGRERVKRYDAINLARTTEQVFERSFRERYLIAA